MVVIVMNEQPQAKAETQNNKKDIDLTFEQALEKLEGHVRTLEQGDLTLDESLNIFEDGMKLAKFCGRKLDEAEQKIEILLEKNGKIVTEDFKKLSEEKD
jgi:exodeoxyribonuclease VII small subunit